MQRIDALRPPQRQRSVPNLRIAQGQAKTEAATETKLRRLSAAYLSSPVLRRSAVYDFPQTLCRQLLASVGDYIVCRDTQRPQLLRIDYIDATGQFSSLDVAAADLEFALSTKQPLEFKQRYQGSAFDAEFAIADDSLEDCSLLSQASSKVQQRCFRLILAAQRYRIARLLAKEDHQVFQKLVEHALDRQDSTEIQWLLETCQDILKQAACPAFYAAYHAVCRRATLQQYRCFVELFGEQQYSPRDPKENMKRLLQNPDGSLYLRSNPDGHPIDQTLLRFALDHGSQAVITELIKQGQFKETDYRANNPKYPQDLRCFLAFFEASEAGNKATEFLCLAPTVEAVDAMLEQGAELLDTSALEAAVYYGRREVAAQLLLRAPHTLDELIGSINAYCEAQGARKEYARYAGLFLGLGRGDLACSLVRACRPDYYAALRECLKNARFAVWGNALGSIVQACTEKLAVDAQQAYELLELCCLAGYVPQQIRDLIEGQLKELISAEQLQVLFAVALKAGSRQLIPLFVDWAARLDCEHALLLNCLCANDSHSLEALFDAHLQVPEDVQLCIREARKRRNLTACALLQDADAESIPQDLLGIDLALMDGSERKRVLFDVYLNSKPEEVWWLIDSLREMLGKDLPRLESWLHGLAPLVIPYQRTSHRKDAMKASGRASTNYLDWQLESAMDRQRRVKATLKRMQEPSDFLSILHCLRETEREFHPMRKDDQVLQLRGRLTAAEDLLLRLRRRYATEPDDKQLIKSLENGDYQISAHFAVSSRVQASPLAQCTQNHNCDIDLTCVEVETDTLQIRASDPAQQPRLLAQLQLLYADLLRTKNPSLIPKIYWLFVHTQLDEDPDGELALMLHEVLRRYCARRPVAISPVYTLPHLMALATSCENFTSSEYEHVFEELPALDKSE